VNVFESTNNKRLTRADSEATSSAVVIANKKAVHIHYGPELGAIA
jgi:hypothetical protein